MCLKKKEKKRKNSGTLKRKKADRFVFRVLCRCNTFSMQGPGLEAMAYSRNCLVREYFISISTSLSDGLACVYMLCYFILRTVVIYVKPG